ncbi:hypothetical protein SLIQ_16265 [Serratia liquefaciens FK01]|nr:hypothetical protein SLIQ_16265 [Serratia liquefaciens FK01]
MLPRIQGHGKKFNGTRGLLGVIVCFSYRKEVGGTADGSTVGIVIKTGVVRRKST